MTKRAELNTPWVDKNKPPAEEVKQEKSSTRRDDKRKVMTVRMPPEMLRTLRIVAAENEVSANTAVLMALNTLFQRNGKKVVHY